MKKEIIRSEKDENCMARGGMKRFKVSIDLKEEIQEDDVAYTFRLVLGGFVGTYHFGCLSVRQEL